MGTPRNYFSGFQAMAGFWGRDGLPRYRWRFSWQNARSVVFARVRGSFIGGLHSAAFSAARTLWAPILSMQRRAMVATNKIGHSCGSLAVFAAIITPTAPKASANLENRISEAERVLRAPASGLGVGRDPTSHTGESQRPPQPPGAHQAPTSHQPQRCGNCSLYPH